MTFRQIWLAFSCMTLLLVAGVAAGQQTTYMKILLPVMPSSIEGQNGARWVTELTLTNSGYDPLPLLCFTESCPPIDARSVARIDAPPTSSVQPGLMYVSLEDSRRLWAALRSRNSTPNSDEKDFISEIPVVREYEFRSSTVDITAVPVEANYRHMLRIYDANANEGAKVRLRVYGMANGHINFEPLIDRELTLHTSRGSASPYPKPDEPSWISVPNFTDEPGVRDFTEVHVRIDAESANTALWAMATATSNTTQRFAVYTP
jgi:hypothetical protein